MATLSSTPEAHASATEVKHLADRLNAAQIKLKRLARLEAAIVDFFMEIMDRTASLPSALSSQTAPVEDSAFAKAKRKDEYLKKAEGDPIALLNTLRTHLRMQFTSHEQHYHEMQQALKTQSVRGERDAHDASAEIRQWEAACEKAQQQMHALSHQLTTSQADYDRTARQYSRTLEQLNTEVHALRATNETQREQLAKRLADVEELKHANDALSRDRKRVTDELARAGDYLRAGGGSPLNGGVRVDSGLFGSTPADQQNLKRVLQDYECKLSKLEATNDELRMELQRQQQHLSNVKQSTQAQHCFKLEKDAKKLREGLEEKTKTMTEQEAELLRTRATLKERDALIRDMKDEYNKLFTAMQKIKQTPSQARPLVRSSSMTQVGVATSRTNSAKNVTKATPDSREASATHMRAQANENPYLLDHYKSRIEQQEKEIERLHTQLRKMIASEYRNKQKNKLFRVERVQLKDTCDNLRGELERAVKTTAKAMAQQMPFLLDAESGIEAESRQLRHEHDTSSDDGDKEPMGNQFCCTIADVRRLRQRNQYLEARFRSGDENGNADESAPTDEPGSQRPPRPSSSTIGRTDSLRTSVSSASIPTLPLGTERSIDATTMQALKQVKHSARARPQSAGPRARLDLKSSSIVTKSLV